MEELIERKIDRLIEQGERIQTLLGKNGEFFAYIIYSIKVEKDEWGGGSITVLYHEFEPPIGFIKKMFNKLHEEYIRRDEEDKKRKRKEAEEYLKS